MSKQCYSDFGGREFVIGGTLRFLPGSEIVGLENVANAIPVDATPVPSEAPAFPDSTATTVAQLRNDFNALLSVLRNAGVIADGEAE